MPKFFNTNLLIAAFVLFFVSCKKDDLPTQAFSGTWTTAAIATHGFKLNAADDNTLSGVVFLDGAEGAATPQAFSGGHWELSEDQKALTLDFGTAQRFGVREYAVLSVLDHNVVHLQIREKDNPAAPVLTLER